MCGGAEGAAGALWVVRQTLGAAERSSIVTGRSPEKHECGKSVEPIRGRAVSRGENGRYHYPCCYLWPWRLREGE